jgi:hypothetical protein
LVTKLQLDVNSFIDLQIPVIYLHQSIIHIIGNGIAQGTAFWGVFFMLCLDKKNY